jgi:hypothetical protein
MSWIEEELEELSFEELEPRVIVEPAQKMASFLTCFARGDPCCTLMSDSIQEE